MIKRKTQVITQKFKAGHKGVDLRCVNFTNWINQDVICPEECRVKRSGIDGYGNYYLVVEPLETKFDELKFIHIRPVRFDVDEIIKEGQYISKCLLGGNSKSLHLHFEVWKGGKAINPTFYFDVRKIKYKFK